MVSTASLPMRRIGLALAAGVVLFSALAVAQDAISVGELSAGEIEDELQKCALVESLNEHKRATSPQTTSLMSKIFAVLFPGSPAVNAILATIYISGPPNFLLALCPPNIDPSSLSVMVAFAVGGLLGDTIFHLLPEIFLGEDAPDHVRFVMVEPNRNLLLGLGIMVGFFTFVAMDKALRIATGGQGGHSHSHSHSHEHGQIAPSATTTSSSATTTNTTTTTSNNVKNRKPAAASSPSSSTSLVATPEPATSTSIKLGGYLNLIADFTHNITDGLAMSSSFYASPTIGATTTVAVFFHEIPHEVGDFALLIQSGFSKRKAMGAQFVTAIGAFLGTFIGIAVQELGGNSAAAAAAGAAATSSAPTAGLLGTSLTWGDMLLPFTAGTFLYVGTVSVIPELLETSGRDKRTEVKHMITQFLAVAAGAGIMLWISWD